MSRLQTGDPAPEFSLTSNDDSTVSLSDFAGQSVIIYFYPAAMTPGCTTQACDFRDSLEPLRAAGYRVIGISPDQPAKLARFVAKEGLTFPLLSDPDRQVLQAYGAFGEKTMYGKTVTGVIRSTVVVGPDGRVTLAKYNARAKGHVAGLAKALGVAIETRP